MKRLPILFVLLALVAAACGGDSAESTTTTTSSTSSTTTTVPAEETTTTAAEETTTTAAEETTTTTEAAAAPPFVTTADTDLGTLLTDHDGMTLYLFLPDNQGPSTCTGTCASTWPPFVGDVTAGPGVDPELVGSVERDDGAMQATYNGWPLYFYAPDTEPGHTRGQGIGGNWWVVDPDGDAIR